MRRYLVVANQTLCGEHLVEEVRRRIRAEPCSFHVVVPASAPADRFTWVEEEAYAVAAERLHRALRRFREIGAEAHGEVGDPRPLEAIRDVLLREPFDAIIVSTLPPGPSRWLKLDLPNRVAATFGLPVTHLIGEAEPIATPRAGNA
jgi:GABA permease